MGKRPNGLCECGRQETVKHVFLECIKYNLIEKGKSLKRLSGLGDMQLHQCMFFLSFLKYFYGSQDILMFLGGKSIVSKCSRPFYKGKSSSTLRFLGNVKCVTNQMYYYNNGGFSNPMLM